MSRAVKQGVFRDGNGAVVTTARAGTVSVFLSGTKNPADIYTSSTGGVAIHSVNTDASGRFKFYIDYSVYSIGQEFDIVLSGTGINSQTYQDELVYLLPFAPHEVDTILYGSNTLTKATIDAALTAIGTTNKATLLLRPGTWIISSNADWSAYTNVTFKIVPGAMISHGAFTVNIPNAGQGPYQWLVGTGAVTFSGTTERLYSEWWGAKADGSTSNEVALTAAITAAITQGIPLKLLKGQYNYTKIVIPDAGITTRKVNLVIEGAGSPGLGGQGDFNWVEVGGTVLHSTVADGSHAITFAPAFTAAIITLRDIEFRGPDNDSTTTSGDGLHFVGPVVSNLYAITINFENIIVNYYGGGTGVYLSFCENGSARNLTVSRNNYGMKLVTATNANSFYNFVAQGNTTYGLYIDSSSSLGFFGGLIQGDGGIKITSVGSGGGLSNIIFQNYHFETLIGNYAIDIEGIDNSHTIANIVFDTAGFFGTNAGVLLTAVTSGSVSGITFRNIRSINTVSPWLTIDSVNVNNTNLGQAGPLVGAIVDNGYGTELPHFEYRGSGTFNPGTIASGTGVTSSNITVAGATTNIFYVTVSAPYDLQGCTVTAYISGNQTVKIRVDNNTGGAVTLASGTWLVKAYN